MKLGEIEELMNLKGWSMTRLAAELDVSEATVYSWFREGKQRRHPGGPTCILLRQWLAEAREGKAGATA